MGKLIDGKWVQGSVISSNKKGEFDRKPRTFRNSISSSDANFQPESSRYHLYVSYACPWAQRTLIFRKLKQLEDHITVSVVHPDMLEMGWSFDSDFEGATGDNLFGLNYIHQIYQKAQSDISTSATVPILWDKKSNTIVNNESSEIIRIFNSGFNELTGDSKDFYPEQLRAEIDKFNEEIYENINNGVYRTGFSKNQEAYNIAVTRLFESLERLEQHFKKNEFLVGNKLTEADIRLVPTLLRFDLVYYVHFKCSLKRISDMPNLFGYLKRLFKMPEIKETTNFEHIKRHYYYSHESINPYRIVPNIEPNIG